MKKLGLVLVGVGIVVLIYGGFSYNRQHTILDVGGIKATTTERHEFPVSPIAGGAMVVVGLVLLTVPTRRTAGA